MLMLLLQRNLLGQVYTHKAFEDIVFQSLWRQHVPPTSEAEMYLLAGASRLEALIMYYLLCFSLMIGSGTWFII